MSFVLVFDSFTENHISLNLNYKFGYFIFGRRFTFSGKNFYSRFCRFLFFSFYQCYINDPLYALGLSSYAAIGFQQLDASPKKWLGPACSLAVGFLQHCRSWLGLRETKLSNVRELISQKNLQTIGVGINGLIPHCSFPQLRSYWDIFQRVS